MFEMLKESCIDIALENSCPLNMWVYTTTYNECNYWQPKMGGSVQWSWTYRIGKIHFNIDQFAFYVVGGYNTLNCWWSRNCIQYYLYNHVRKLLVLASQTDSLIREFPLFQEGTVLFPLLQLAKGDKRVWPVRLKFPTLLTTILTYLWE